MSKDFAKLVLAANIIALPIAYIAMNRWLQNFAYKIELSWWIFVLGGLLTLSIALITVGFQTFKASRANPIDVIRHE